jgi:hypothetical protein
MLMRHTARLAPLQQARAPAASRTVNGGAAQHLGRYGGRLKTLGLHPWQLWKLSQPAHMLWGSALPPLC